MRSTPAGTMPGIWQFPGSCRACLLGHRLPCCLERALSQPLRGSGPRSQTASRPRVRPLWRDTQSRVALAKLLSLPRAALGKVCSSLPSWVNKVSSCASVPQSGDSTSYDTPALAGPHWPRLGQGSSPLGAPALPSLPHLYYRMVIVTTGQQQ